MCRMIEQSHEILVPPVDALVRIEQAARTCYKTEDRITPESAVPFVRDTIMKRGHTAMIEFADMTVRFITNRGVSHEIVRHRIFSFAQESTRYVRYKNGLVIIKPVWWDESSEIQRTIFLNGCDYAGRTYAALVEEGWSAQKAREVLPNATKTEIVVKGNLREWRHAFQLRCDNTAHPQTVALMRPLLAEVKKMVPVLFDDLNYAEV